MKTSAQLERNWGELRMRATSSIEEVLAILGKAESLSLKDVIITGGRVAPEQLEDTSTPRGDAVMMPLNAFEEVTHTNEKV